MKNRYGSTGGQIAAGVAMTVVGVGAAGFFGLGMLGTALIFESPVALGILGALGVASLSLVALGIGRLLFCRTFKTYRDIIGVRTYCYLDEIAQRTSASPRAVRLRAARMIKRGLFKQAALDDEGAFLIMTAEARAEYRAAREEAARHARDLEADADRSRAIEEALDAHERDQLARASEALAQLRTSTLRVKDETAAQQARRIERAVGCILEHAATRSGTASKLDRLTSYYLPTTVKLLDAYATLEESETQTDSIRTSKREITATLTMLAEAYEMLLDELFLDMTWDVSTDISVLKTMLAQDGLTKGAFDDAPATRTKQIRMSSD